MGARRPHALTGPHRTRSQAKYDWDGANAGSNEQWITVQHISGWYAMDREAFETDNEAADRLKGYLENGRNQKGE